jgi:hypothetical protein
MRERFMRFVSQGRDYEGPDGCWIWHGSLNASEYGTFSTARSYSQHAHRVSYRLFIGAIPDGLFVCHDCDVRYCVRPEHLFLGTHDDNMRDACAKGRQARGNRHGRRKLSADDVRSILASPGEKGCDLAKRYGVTPGNITMIRQRKIWGDVNANAS